MALTLPYPNIKAGDSIIAGQLKLNFDAVVTEVNGNLTTNSLSPTAGILDSQLAQITSPGKVDGGSITTGTIAIGQLSTVLNAITTGLLIDGSGSPIVAGVATGCIPVPFTGTITNIKVFCDVATSAVLDLWMDSFAAYPPTVADTITASAKPTLSTALTYTDSTLTGWTKSVAAGNVIKVNIDSNDLATWIVVAITFTRTA